MRLEWILLHPAAPYAVFAIGLTLCLSLFISVKRDMRGMEKRWRKRIESLEADLEKKTAALDELTRISGLLVAPPPLRSGLNLTRRSQALQMIRRGEAPHEIAAALSLPQNEVDLLLKLQRLSESATRAAGS